VKTGSRAGLRSSARALRPLAFTASADRPVVRSVLADLNGGLPLRLV
jgi:hypothetical protein